MTDWREIVSIIQNFAAIYRQRCAQYVSATYTQQTSSSRPTRDQLLLSKPSSTIPLPLRPRPPTPPTSKWTSPAAAMQSLPTPDVSAQSHTESNGVVEQTSHSSGPPRPSTPPTPTLKWSTPIWAQLPTASREKAELSQSSSVSRINGDAERFGVPSGDSSWSGAGIGGDGCSWRDRWWLG